MVGFVLQNVSGGLKDCRIDRFFAKRTQLPPLFEADAGPLAVAIDEDHTRMLERTTDISQSADVRRSRAALKISNRLFRDFRGLLEVILRPANKCTRSAALSAIKGRRCAFPKFLP